MLGAPIITSHARRASIGRHESRPQKFRPRTLGTHIFPPGRQEQESCARGVGILPGVCLVRLQSASVQSDGRLSRLDSRVGKSPAACLPEHYQTSRLVTAFQHRRLRAVGGAADDRDGEPPSHRFSSIAPQPVVPLTRGPWVPCGAGTREPIPFFRSQLARKSGSTFPSTRARAHTHTHTHITDRSESQPLLPLSSSSTSSSLDLAG